MKLSVSQLRRIIKEEVTKAVMKEALSDDEKQEIEDAIAPILDSGIPLSKVISTIRDLEKGASKRLGYEEPEPGESRLHSYGRQAMDEDYGSGYDERDPVNDPPYRFDDYSTYQQRRDAKRRERERETGMSYADEYERDVQPSKVDRGWD